jgi:DsbC/DsbD-like thiol-disulfide interchange protein
MTATSIRIAFALLLSVLAPTAALAARSDWSPAAQSKLRLLLAAPEVGRIAGGVEILLEPGWYTYWRTPGEAGLPPVFDFSGSRNVADVEVRYPAPERYDDGSSVSLIYREEVVFPIVVTPTDTARPVTLKVEARYGVCHEVCIPTVAAATLTQPASAPADPLAEARLQSFSSRVPNGPEPGRFDVERVVLEGDSLRIEVRMPESAYADLFAEPPSGWFIGQPTFVSRTDGVSTYRLDLAGRPQHEEPQSHRFRFVAVAGGEAIEEEVEIR